MIVTAILLALALATLSAVLAGPLLRWCRVPAEPGDPGSGADFGYLATPRFRWTVLGVSLIAGLLAFSVAPPALWAAWAPLVLLGPLLGLVDLHTTFLPSRLTYLGTGLTVVGAGVASWLQTSWLPLLTAAVGGASAAGFFWLLWRWSGGQLGFGDVRLAGFIGVTCGVTGLPAVWHALLLGSVAGAVWGLVARWRRGAEGAFPYGPALLLGPLLALALSWF